MAVCGGYLERSATKSMTIFWGLDMTSNNALEADRDASWPHRARNGLRRRGCAIAARPAAQLDR